MPLCLWQAIGCCFFFSCGEEITQSHSFWSLSILQQNLPWINVLFPCLRLGFLFWAKVTILDFLPNFRCMLLTFRLLSPKGLLTDLWECRSSTDCTGEAGSWLWAGEHLKFSAGSWCSPRKKCSELWKVKQLKMNVFNSKKKKKKVFIPINICLYFLLARAMVVNTPEGVWSLQCPTDTHLRTTTDFCFPLT